MQRRINEEFGISMTYMDVRFLVLDIGAELKDKEPPKKEEPAEEKADAAPAAMADEDAADAADAAAEDEAIETEPLPIGNGKVSVTLDKVVRAGALASGTVIFSDGVEGGWMLDQMGRLALTKISQPGYQPSEADIQAFQVELQRMVMAGGY